MAILTNHQTNTLGKNDDTDLLTFTSGELDVAGTVDATNFKVGGAQGTDGQVLTSTGSGVAWEDASGGGGGSGTGHVGTTRFTTSFTLTNADKGKRFVTDVGNLTVTLPVVSTLDSDWFVELETEGSYNGIGSGGFSSFTGVLNIDPQYYSANGQRINGRTDWTMPAHSWGRMYYSGTTSQGYNFGSHATSSWTVIATTDGAKGRATATGRGSFAAGGQANATGGGSIVLGQMSTASGTDSVAVGTDTTSSGYKSVAISSGGSSYGASGSYSTSIGRNCKATANDAVAIGDSCLAQANNAVAIGDGAICVASDGTNGVAIGNGAVVYQEQGMAFGKNANSDVKGKIVFSSHSNLGSFGDSQQGLFILKADTTGSSAEKLTTNNSSANLTNQIRVVNYGAVAFSGMVIARRQWSSGTGTEASAWKIEGLAKNEVGSGNVSIVSSTVTAISVANSNYAVAISADNTFANISITVTGAGSYNLKWVANITTCETLYQ